MKVSKDSQQIGALILGFGVLYLLFKWEGFLWIGGLLGGLGLVSPFLRKYILKVWFKIAETLGSINSRVILSIIFYLILTPIALLSRLLGKDSLQLKKGNKKDSYFRIRNHQFTSDDFKNPW